MAAQPLNQNIDPQNALNREINFATTNLSNGNQFIEPHTVTLLNGNYNIPLNNSSIQGNPYGPCIVVPLTTNINNGAPYLKFHFPQNNESVMYITFAQKNNSMSDGYYDYIQGIPDTYRSALRTWIRDDRPVAFNQPITLPKTLTFNVKGIDTNLASASVTFTVTFQAQFGTAIFEDDVATNLVTQ